MKQFVINKNSTLPYLEIESKQYLGEFLLENIADGVGHFSGIVLSESH